MKFLQIMEFRTSHMDEIDALMQQWLAATDGRRTLSRELQAHDRDRPGTYVMVAEFPSYEDAQRNNELPETAEIAQKVEALADGPVAFRNLDCVGEWTA